jgi:hypothetical protein
VVTTLRRTGFFDEPEVTSELLADRFASRIRFSQQRSDVQPDGLGKVFE